MAAPHKLFNKNKGAVQYFMLPDQGGEIKENLLNLLKITKKLLVKERW